MSTNASLHEPLMSHTTTDAGAPPEFPSLPDLREPTGPDCKYRSDSERIQIAIEAACQAAETKFGERAESAVSCVRHSKACIGFSWRVISMIVKLYIWVFRVGNWCYKSAPKEVVKMVFGLTLAFFGGTYLVTLAAIEAARKVGGESLWHEVRFVFQQATIVSAASTKDDNEDANNDGVADTDQLPPHELLQRKVRVAMEAVTEPARLQIAVGAIWAAYLAVLASLKLKFARTVAIALGVADIIRLPATRLFAPLIAVCLGSKLRHWAPTIVSSVINLLVMTVVWYIQMIISAFYSGLRGGKIFGEAFVRFIAESKHTQKLLSKVPGVHMSPDDTYLDEVCALLVFAAGFSFQLLTAFKVPFPLDIVLWPIWLIEQLLRWQITFADDSPLGSGSTLTG